MTSIVESMVGEYLRYQALAEAALSQLSDAELAAPSPGNGNSIATICWHVSGNLQSRFADFLSSDGEKPWRQREEEFAARTVTKAELLAHWAKGWSVLLGTLATLDDSMLSRTVTIRKQPLSVDQALMRSLAHVSYHVGQVVFAARALRGAEWRFLSIPPGQTDAYNAKAGAETPAAHVARVRDAVRG